MDWYKANKLSLNVDKTVLLKFLPGDKPFTINVEGTKIKTHNTPNFWEFLLMIVLIGKNTQITCVTKFLTTKDYCQMQKTCYLNHVY